MEDNMTEKHKKKRLRIEGLDVHNFDKLIRSAKNSREQRRYLAFAHIKDGKTFTESAKMVRVSLRSLMN